MLPTFPCGIIEALWHHHLHTFGERAKGIRWCRERMTSSTMDQSQLSRGSLINLCQDKDKESFQCVGELFKRETIFPANFSLEFAFSYLSSEKVSIKRSLMKATKIKV